MMPRAIRSVAVLGAILFLLPTAASATTVQQAFGLCDKDPKCKSTVTKAGDVIFTNGTYIVSCPMEGPCSCDVCRAAGSVKAGVIRPAQPADFQMK
jgi:hypothetical protein